MRWFGVVTAWSFAARYTDTFMSECVTVHDHAHESHVALAGNVSWLRVKLRRVISPPEVPWCVVGVARVTSGSTRAVCLTLKLVT